MFLSLSLQKGIALRLAGYQAEVKLGPYNKKRSLSNYNDVHEYICKRIIMKKQPNNQPKLDWPTRIAESHKMFAEEISKSKALSMFEKGRSEILAKVIF